MQPWCCNAQPSGQARLPRTRGKLQGTDVAGCGVMEEVVMAKTSSKLRGCGSRLNVATRERTRSMHKATGMVTICYAAMFILSGEGNARAASWTKGIDGDPTMAHDF